MTSFEEVVKQEALKNQSDIFSFNYEDKKYWLKRARAVNPNKIQTFFYKFFPFELLIPSLAKSKKDALEFEISKLEEFSKLGVNVPKIAYNCEDFFVLEDCGRSVNRYFKNRKLEKEEFYPFTEKLLLELAKIHNLGLFHGGAQLRNFAYKDEKIYVIDFEESFDTNITLDTLQFRDFLLFLLSFTKFKKYLSFDVDYKFIIDKYIEFTNKKDLSFKLKEISQKLSFFTCLSQLFFIKRFLGSDVLSFFKLLKILNSLDSKVTP